MRERQSLAVAAVQAVEAGLLPELAEEAEGAPTFSAALLLRLLQLVSPSLYAVAAY